MAVDVRGEFPYLRAFIFSLFSLLSSYSFHLFYEINVIFYSKNYTSPIIRQDHCNRKMAARKLHSAVKISFLPFHSSNS